jgi:hypothetical protein
MRFEETIDEEINKLNRSLESFLSHYDELYKGMSFNRGDLKFNYTKVGKFIMMAITNLKPNDRYIVDNLVVKKIKSIDALEEYYTKLLKYKQPQDVSEIYINKDSRFKKILLSNSFDTEDDKEKFVQDAKAYYMKRYQEYYKRCKFEVCDILNSKYYILNKIFWRNVNLSPDMNNYFNSIRQPSPYSLKTFLNIYLKKMNKCDLDNCSIDAKKDFENIQAFMKIEE